MVITIHALSYLGAVIVLLNTKLTNRELQYQIDDAEISTLLYLDVLAEKATHIQTNTMKSFTEVNSYGEIDQPLQEEINLANPFTIIYTSGTTGFPKGVIHTYGNHWWSAIGSALNLGLDENDKWLADLTIFYVGGLSIFIIYMISYILFSYIVCYTC